MSWSIGVLKNTVKVSKKCAKNLIDAEDDIEISGQSPVDGSELFFDSDEGADWLENGPAMEILERHKVKGEVLFGSVEGDNAGTFWGYRFVPGQKTIRLKGSIEWTEA